MNDYHKPMTAADEFQTLEDCQGVELDSNVPFRFACCDCGLVHRVVIVSQDTKPVGFAVKRDQESTDERRATLTGFEHTLVYAFVPGPVRYEFRDGVNGCGMYESGTGPYVPAKAYDTLLLRLLAMLQQAQIEAGVLSRIIDVLDYSGDIQRIPERLAAMLPLPSDAHGNEMPEPSQEWRDTERKRLIAAMRDADDNAALLAMLTTPAEADVREAGSVPPDLVCAEVFFSDVNALGGFSPYAIKGMADALLSYVRAVQQPRLTEEQVEAVKAACAILNEERTWMQERWRVSNKLRAVFPELFGKEG